MAYKIADRVKETTATTGTGTLSLAGAAAGFQTAAAGIGDGNSSAFCITDGADWEVFLGAAAAGSPDTLTRATVLASSNAGGKVSWGAGSKTVFLCRPGGSNQDLSPTGSVGAPGISFLSDRDNGAYLIGADNWALAVAGARALELDPIGAVLMPLQPCVIAYNSASDSDQTGNGATATVDFDAEVLDQNGDFAADTFTAPVSGSYEIAFTVRLSNFGAGASSIKVSLVTSNRSWNISWTSGVPTSNATFVVGRTVIADMDAGDTASVQVTVLGMAGDTVTVDGSANMVTSFSARLAA